MRLFTLATLAAVLSTALGGTPVLAQTPLDPAVPPKLTGFIPSSQGVLGCERYMNKRVLLYPLACDIKCSVANAVAIGKGPDSSVGEAMTHEVKYCFEDQDVEDVSENMSDLQVRRLPVVNRDKRLVGIVSLADIATNGEVDCAGEALEGITRRGGAHSQSHDARA